MVRLKIVQDAVLAAVRENLVVDVQINFFGNVST